MFEITKNNLMRQSEIKSLKLQNEYYTVTIFYCGDYEKDYESGKCNIENISVSCKSKQNVFPLTCMEGKIFVDICGNDLLSVEQAAMFKEQLDIAYKSAFQLQDIMKQYFLINT